MKNDKKNRVALVFLFMKFESLKFYDNFQVLSVEMKKRETGRQSNTFSSRSKEEDKSTNDSHWTCTELLHEWTSPCSAMGVWGAKSGNEEKNTVKMCHEVVGADGGKWWWWWFFPFYEIQSDMRKEREYKFSSESTRISPLESRNIFRILCVLWMMMWINRKQGVLSPSGFHENR